MLQHGRSFAELYGKLTALERTAQEAGSAPRDFGGSRLKIPDQAGWKFDVLKDREDGFQLWRESFDLQTGSIWHGMEKFLETFRELKLVVDVEQYNMACHSHWLDPIGDWNYDVVSRKLYMVLHTYVSNDVRKVLSKSVDKCGFEAYCS